MKLLLSNLQYKSKLFKPKEKIIQQGTNIL